MHYTDGISDRVSIYRFSGKGTAHSALISTYSLVENDPTVLCSSGTVHLLGFCTGLLPAAAAATADSVKALLELTPKIISLSLHLSLNAHQRSQEIEPSVDSWTMVVSDMNATDAREELDKFHANNVNIHWHSNPSLVLILKGVAPAQTSVHQRSHGLFC